MSALDERLRAGIHAELDRLVRGVTSLQPHVEVSRVGRVVDVGDGVATAVGLATPAAGELLDVAGIPARAEIVTLDEVRLVLLGEGDVESGALVRRRGRVLDVPAGVELIGRVVDAVGRPLDGRGPLRTRRRVAIDSATIPLRDREPVSRPLRTGIFVLDAMIPVGRGQRELIVGDRATGKSKLGLDILAALDPDIIGIYTAIGRRGADVAARREDLRSAGFFEHGFAVAAGADARLGLIHLAPYAACAMAEDLMLAGRDVVLILDSITHHAHAHRTLALLLGRPVGREAYPADVFYAHARLLERSTQLGERRGGGSLTTFPIVETQGGDLAAYLPTNLVSITDGQIRMDAALVAQHHLPAVDVGLSVSRVGGKAQLATIRALAGDVKTRYAQFLELETFTRFGAQPEQSVRDILAWGRLTRHLLRQGRQAAFRWSDSVVRLLILRHPDLPRVPLDALDRCVAAAAGLCRERVGDAVRRLDRGHSLADDILASLRACVDEAVRAELPPPPGQDDPDKPTSDTPSARAAARAMM